ncbi:MAG TPA: PQQ-binding-like beta-propeller repeat protein [Actinomycetota bacterium]
MRRNGISVLLALAVSMGAAGPASAAGSSLVPAAPTNWSQFGFSPQHASLNPFETVLGPSNVGTLTLSWSGPFDFNPICCSSPVVVNGVVYVGTGDNRERAYRASDGTILWNANVGGGEVSTAAVSHGVVFVGSGDWNVYAFSAQTGIQQWAYKTGGPVVGGPTVVGRVVYVGSDDGKVYALNATNGALLWTTSIGGEINHSPTVAHRVLYVGNFTGSFDLYALDVATGTIKWTAPTGGYLDWNTPALVNGVVYVASVDGEAYAFDAVTGARLWQVTLPDLVEASPAVSGGLVYIGAYDGHVYALDAATGARRWRATTGNIIAGAAAVANGVVYVGSTDNHGYAFDAATGTKLWSAAFTGPDQFAEPIVADARVYFAADKLYAFALP